MSSWFGAFSHEGLPSVHVLQLKADGRPCFDPICDNILFITFVEVIPGAFLCRFVYSFDLNG